MWEKPEAKYSAFYRRTAVVLKLVRFAVLLFLVVFSIFCIGFFKDNITTDNLRYLLKYIDLSSTDNTPSGAQIDISPRENCGYVMLHNDLAVVSDKATELYDFAGNKLYSYEYTYTEPAFVSNGKRILVHDISGKQLSVYSSVSKLFDMTFDYEVKAADINQIGCFAVISSEKTYRSGVIVFDSDGKEVFRWMSPDLYVISCSLNSTATEIVCASVRSMGGSFETELVVYNTSTGQKVNSLILEGKMAYKVGYVNDDSNIYVLTDSTFELYDKNLEKNAAFAYAQRGAAFYREFDDCFVMAHNDSISGSRMTVTAYGYDGRLLFEQGGFSNINDVWYSDNTLYVLWNDRLSIYDYEGENGILTELYVQELDRQYKAVRTDNYARYILIDSSGAQRFSLARIME